MAAAPLLAMHDVALAYGEVQALCGVSLEVARGEVLALLGENGAGKSSLMAVLAGAVRPQRGTMTVDGRDYRPLSPRDAAAAGVAMIHQELSLLPHLTVGENLWLAARQRGRPTRSALAGMARSALARVGHAELPHDVSVGALPQATRQLVEIARALWSRPRLLVMDEPTSSLGADEVPRLFGVVRGLAEQGVAVIYISHHLDEVRHVASRFTVLRDGAAVHSGMLTEVGDDELVRSMAGRTVQQLFPAGGRPAGRERLLVDALRGRPLRAPVSFGLRAGEIAGIAGLCGAGRTELLELLFGLRPSSGGTLRLDGIELRGGPAQRWAAGVAMLVEDRKHEGLATARDLASNLLLPQLSRLSRGGWLPAGRLHRQAAPWLQRLGVRCRSSRQPAGSLSGGNQQKVALARLLACNPRVLLLDEPTRGVDVGSRQEIYTLLDAAARGGAALLVVSSQLPELLGLCDRIAVMARGVLSPFRPRAQWSDESLLQAALAPAAAAEAAP